MVENEQIISELVAFFNDENYEVDICETGAEASDKIVKIEYALAILDRHQQL